MMEPSKRSTKFIKVYMDAQCILLPLHQVRLVLRLPALQHVPSKAKGFEGILNYHGTHVPVYALASCLNNNSPEYTLETPLVLCELNDGALMGLLVSQVTEVIDAVSDQIKIPKLIDFPPFVCGIYSDQQETMWVIQLDKLIHINQQSLNRDEGL